MALIDYISPLPTPHHLFPRALGLAYRNLNEYYDTYTYIDGEQMNVANHLVSSMLAFYFPKSTFTLQRLPIQPVSLIETVHKLGTIYWTVSVKGSPPKKKEKQREDTMIFLLAIVTEKSFQKRPGRSTPSNLHFSKSISTASGSINIAGRQFRCGHVVILGGRPDPLNLSDRAPTQYPAHNPFSPTWEFYGFDAACANDSQVMLPWYGPTAANPNSLATNIFSLAKREVDMVDRMFKCIVNCALGDQAPPSPDYLPKIEASPVPAAKEEEASLPAVEACDTPSADPVIEELKKYRIRQDHRLVWADTGKVVELEKAHEVKDLAREYGYTFEVALNRMEKEKGKRKRGST
jgi:hypothetical protein